MGTQSGQIPQFRSDLPAAMSTPMRKSWLRTNWLWLLGGFAVCMVLLISGIVMLVFGAIRGSDVAKAATAAAQSNAAVQQSLGAPIEEGFFVSGSINVTDSSGDADLSVPISGPKGKATVYVTGRKTAGAWDYSLMQAVIAGTGKRIDLLAATAPSAAAVSPVPQPAVPADSAVASADPPPSSVAPSSGLASDFIQSQDSTTSGIVAELTQATRSEGVLTIKVRFRNTSNKPGSVTFTHWNATAADDQNFYVTAGNKKYFMLQDADGTALSTNSTGNGVGANLDPGNTFVWWAKYPAPPVDVKKFNFMMPITTPFEDVPITDK